MAVTYFDHNATTPLDPRVREAMLPWLGEHYGNPASIHACGQAAREAVEAAREEVARLLGARPPEIVFTASGTEANNTVMRSTRELDGRRSHLVVSEVEHPSVLRVAEYLADTGTEVTWVPPEGHGRVDADRLLAALRADTHLVCLVLANSEVGSLQPVEQVAATCRERGVPVHCDAVQAVGKIPVHVEELGCDYLSVGAHKFYGPLGAAALWVRREAPLSPLLFGGSQERRRRAGTVNVPAVVGMGAAARLALEEMEDRRQHLEALRRGFELGLQQIADVTIHATGSTRLANTSHVAFAGVDSESLLIRLDLRGFAVSAGTACSSGTVEPSRTLLAMGVSREEAHSSIRVSFGVTNTAAEIEAFLEVLTVEVAELRRLASATS